MYLLWKLFFFAVLLGAISAWQNAVCPAPEDVSPCTCRKDEDYGLMMTCTGISSDDELTSAVSASQGIYFFSVKIQDSHVGNIKADLFSGMKIHSIDLIRAGLSSLTQNNRPPFVGLEDILVGLRIDESFVGSTLTKLSLSHLKRLTYVAISNNNIPTVNNDWFESGPYGLLDLFMIDNKIESIESRAFASLSSLTRLWLSGNHLQEINRNIFPNPANKLMELDLSSNQLSFLPNDIFSGMPALTEINLSHNSLTSLSETVFNPVWSQLATVDVTGNTLFCDTQIKWIYNTRLPENFEGSCEAPASLAGKELKSLKLSDL